LKYQVLSARNPGPWTGDGNHTFLLPGRVPALIDAGVGHSDHLLEIDERLATAGGGTLARVIVTHAHSDHISGAPAIAARWPATVFQKLPWPERDARWQVREGAKGFGWTPLDDGDVVEAGDTSLRIIHTPGHAPDHISLFEEESQTLFCGDLVVAGSTVVIPGGRGGDLAAYLRSLERILALEPRLLLPAHGPEIEDPAAILGEYLAHRRLRERQILDLLAPGPATAESLVNQMYRGLRPELREAALGSVLAHLIKLRDEGRAVEEGTQWRLENGPA
jgi:glyoxylase-like metal-dependent hydrolase (beta-lactamase superfamily II)